MVDNVRPVFTAPREGDVLTAINGAELSKCALTVSQLALLLKALPRPLKLSFMEGSPSLQVTLSLSLYDFSLWLKSCWQEALKSAGRARVGESKVDYPEHMLRHVTVAAGKRIGLHLMTVSHRPVIQAVWNKDLKDQGVKPCDVLVSINGKPIGDIDAVRRHLTYSPCLMPLTSLSSGR